MLSFLLIHKTQRHSYYFNFVIGLTTTLFQVSSHSGALLASCFFFFCFFLNFYQQKWVSVFFLLLAYGYGVKDDRVRAFFPFRHRPNRTQRETKPERFWEKLARAFSVLARGRRRRRPHDMGVKDFFIIFLNSSKSY